ncbi:uncharacterized protein PHALS_12168 [Plasmopara halstedii]|uniref:Uncharacterized protein n=1 Tax=Plasmopara halstedii TaxID=4781 RepID=A0A0P1AL85_PLAHL|nr:uncharacterized protein PHALS_12168 [Plasmopara halstedii]CEG41852.1 hypothetical protein PHALS_12168 [Plasmopara halstedii]|eukprot:XP_024578221.1 hypothetical protein PHALS_12168 [Plasmopara halstedii]
MGGNVSLCGLQASDSHCDPQLQYQSKDCTRKYEQLASMRGRSLSSTTDSSVASILSNSDRLVPDVYMPKDIQVLSQRRQRHGHHHTASHSFMGHSSKNSIVGSSRVSNSSLKGWSTIRSIRNNPPYEIPPSVNKKYNFGIKTASSSFGYSDDETTDPTAVVSRRIE